MRSALRLLGAQLKDSQLGSPNGVNTVFHKNLATKRPKSARLTKKSSSKWAPKASFRNIIVGPAYRSLFQPRYYSTSTTEAVLEPIEANIPYIEKKASVTEAEAGVGSENEVQLEKSGTTDVPRAKPSHTLEHYNRQLYMEVERKEYAFAITQFERMKNTEGLKLDKNSYMMAIEANLKSDHVSTAEELYEETKTLGILSTEIGNVFLQHYAVTKDLENLQEFWMRMELDGLVLDELSWILQLKTQYHVGDMKGFHQNWKELTTKHGQLVTPASYKMMAMYFASEKDRQNVSELLAQVTPKYSVSSLKRDMGNTELVELHLLNAGFQGQFGQVNGILSSLIDAGLVPTTQHCIAAFMGFICSNSMKSAEVFVLSDVPKLIRTKFGFKIDYRVLVRLLLGECTESKNTVVANNLLDALVPYARLDPESMEFETNCMVKLHLDSGEDDLAYKYFESFMANKANKSKTVPLNTARLFIGHAIENNEPMKALRFWNQYSAIIQDSPARDRLGLEALAAAGSAAKARKVFDDMIERSIQPTPGICQAVMRAYINNNDAKRAIAMFEETQENGIAPDVGSYNLIASIYATRGDIPKVQSVIEAMEKDNVQPNTESYNKLLQANINSKKWDQVVSLFESRFDFSLTRHQVRRLRKSKTNNKKETKTETQTIDSQEASPVQQEASQTPVQQDLAETVQKVPSNTETFGYAFTAIQQLQDAKRLQAYWDLWMSMEIEWTSLKEYLPALQAAAANTEILQSILSKLAPKLTSMKFKVTPDQAAQLVKVLRTRTVTQSSPHWASLERFIQPGKMPLGAEPKQQLAEIVKSLSRK